MVDVQQSLSVCVRGGVSHSGVGEVPCAGVTVDLSAVAENWTTLALQVAPALCGAVVKADAYGLGAARVSSTLYEVGCRCFFVATLDEAVALRPVVGESQIVVLHGVVPARVADYLRLSLTPVLATERDVSVWQEQGQGRACWLHCDTAMNRLGFGIGEIPDYVALGLNVVAMMSHLACADEPADFTNVEQLKAFRELQRRYPKMKMSLAASYGIKLGKAYYADIVRPGVALYGGAGMKRVVSCFASVLQVREIAEGARIGYGQFWRADRPSRIATIEAGYSEGFMRALFSRGGAYVQGHFVPMVGRVSMDLITLDVTDLSPDVSIMAGDLVEILGQNQSIDDLAEAMGTISYEVITSLKPRAGRRYVGG